MPLMMVLSMQVKKEMELGESHLQIHDNNNPDNIKPSIDSSLTIFLTLFFPDIFYHLCTGCDPLIHLFLIYFIFM